MIKKIIYGILIIIWMVVIFNFSASNGESSDSKSKGIINFTIEIYEKITNQDLDQDYLVEKLDYPVRKLAHFTEYAILGFLICEFVLCFKMLYYGIFTCLCTFLYAMSDEFHQLFITGRTGQFKDVLIDTAGSIFIVVIIYLIRKVRSKNG